MKKFLFISLIILTQNVFSQKSEELVPNDVSVVLSLNNLSILQKVSLDELVQYPFMEEIYAELFDGSTSGKSLKEVGIDFAQKINAFYGKNVTNEISGFSFGIDDQNLLFKAFDDFNEVESKIAGVRCYKSIFNYLYIKGTSAVVVRISPTKSFVNEQADSIWFARGNNDPYFDGYNYNDEGIEFMSDSAVDSNNGQSPTIIEEEIEEIENDLDNGDDMDIEDPNETASEDPGVKTYWELKDSLLSVFQETLHLNLQRELFSEGNNLVKKDPRYAKRLLHNADAIIYIDNSKNFKGGKGFWIFQSLFPVLYEDVDELYQGNITLGDLFLRENSIDLKLEMQYNETLGKIYKELNSKKFDKRVLKYIPQNNIGFATYNIDLKKGYEKAFETIIPLAKKEKGFDMAATVLVAELMDEFINKKTLFNTYRGSMFSVFNGMQTLKTTRKEYIYDDNFETYEVVDTEQEEVLPSFTLGFSTKRNDIPEKILDFFHKRNTNVVKQNGYWLLENAYLKTLPMYIINVNKLFIVTNDKNLVERHLNGYGKDKISGKIAKAAKKSKFIYTHINSNKALEQFPESMFNAEQNEILRALRGETGTLEIATRKSTKTKTELDARFEFVSSQPNAGKYLLDVVNTIYLITK